MHDSRKADPLDLSIPHTFISRRNISKPSITLAAPTSASSTGPKTSSSPAPSPRSASPSPHRGVSACGGLHFPGEGRPPRRPHIRSPREGRPPRRPHFHVASGFIPRLCPWVRSVLAIRPGVKPVATSAWGGTTSASSAQRPHSSSCWSLRRINQRASC